MKFSPIPNTSVWCDAGDSTLISKSTPPYSVAPSFLIEYVNPQIRNNKMTYEYSVTYHPSISLGLTSRIHPISLVPLGLCLSPEILF